jgi:hypothetical protein
MKIKIIVKFENHERHFFVACGVGDKTFKWLGNVASQRYAMAVPNGILRRRDDYCAITDGSQFQTLNIILPNGENPSPMDFLSDHLQDEDTITIELCSKLPVDLRNGIPKQTHFATLAYSTSQEKLGFESGLLSGSGMYGGGPESEYDEESAYERSGGFNNTHTSSNLHDGLSRSMSKSSLSNLTGHKSTSENPTIAASKANFMKAILKSQTLNDRKISNELEKHWIIISNLLKLLKPSDIPHIKETFFNHWDLLIDVFEFYSSNNPNHHLQQGNNSIPPSSASGNGGRGNNPPNSIAGLSFSTKYYDQITSSYHLEKHDFTNCIEDCNIFPAIQLQSQVDLIFIKSCSLMTKASTIPLKTNCLNFTGFLLSLILCSQLKYNDTLDAKVISSHSYESIDRLIISNLITLGKHLNCRSLIKKEFLSNDVLSKVKDSYDTLQSNFDKTALKTKDIALTMTIDELTELLYQSQILTNQKDTDFVKTILLEVRKGSIYGREIDNILSDSMKNLILVNNEKNQHHYYKGEEKSQTSSLSNTIDSNDLYPPNEFTFPEFVEGIARSSYYYYTKTSPLHPVISHPITNLTTGATIDDPSLISKIDIGEYLIKGIQDVSDYLLGKKQKVVQGHTKKGKKPTTAGEAK